jgi:hypothetical protein
MFVAIGDTLTGKMAILAKVSPTTIEHNQHCYTQTSIDCDAMFDGDTSDVVWLFVFG